MSDGVDRPGGRAALVRALHVRRHGAQGAVAGAAVALALLLVFVVLPGGTSQATPLYLGLAFVVFVSVTLLAATVQVSRRALALSVPPAAIVHRGATLATAGGALWLVGGLAALGDPLARPIAGLTLPWAPLLSLFGLWAVHTRVKRAVPARLLFAVLGQAGVVGGLLLTLAVTTSLDALLDPTALALPLPTPEGVFVAGLGLFALAHLGGAAGLALVGEQGQGGLLALAAVAPLAWVGVLGIGPLGLGLCGLTLGVCWAGLGRALG